MTEMQAAIGRLQIRKMAEWTRQRQENARVINDLALTLPGLRVPQVPDHVSHACYKYYVFIDQHALKSSWSRDRVMNEIVSRGVPCYTGSCSEVYLEKAFDNTNFRPEKRLPNSMRLADETLMFLVHPTLTQNEIDQTCSVLGDVLHKAVASSKPSFKPFPAGCVEVNYS